MLHCKKEPFVSFQRQVWLIKHLREDLAFYGKLVQTVLSFEKK